MAISSGEPGRLHGAAEIGHPRALTRGGFGTVGLNARTQVDPLRAARIAVSEPGAGACRAHP